ncbi:unnamed protein product [Parnassius apollo]|nr:unnamed protein product [Parnassius apollo]
MTHSYPASNGLSGNSKPGGLSGSAPGYPSNAAPPPYSPVDTHRSYGSNQATNNFGNSYQHPQGPPPPYTNNAHNYGGYGGHGYNPGYNPQAPGYFGNYVSKGQNFGGMSRTGSALTGVGIAGAGVGTILTGLALWNLARSTGHHHHTVIYDNRGQPVAVAPSNNTQPIADPILGDLINCTLTISNDNATEILAIPCAIATSFTPDANVKDSNINVNNPNDTTKCIITVVTKNYKEFMTTIPCSILLSTAASNNVTEPPIFSNDTDNNYSTLIPLNVTAVGNKTLTSQESAVVVNGTFVPLQIAPINQPAALKLTSDSITEYNEKLNCTFEVGEIRDPINPCFSITNDLTVIPLTVTNKP